MITLLALAGGFIFFQFVGYFIHKLFHHPISGRVYRSHKSHHWDLYPPGDFYSELYREPPWYDRPLLYYTPFIVGFTFLLYYILPLHLTAALLVELVLVAWLNDKIHEHFHLKHTWMGKFKIFRRWRDWHFKHHIDDSKNFSIFWYLPDRLFGSMLD